MRWHAQVTSLSLRGWEVPEGVSAQDCFDAKLDWLAACKAEVLGGTLAYVHLASRKDGRELTTGDWREVVRLLRDQYGVVDVLYHRGERLVHVPAHRVG